MPDTTTAPHGATAEPTAQAGPAQGEPTATPATAEPPAQETDWEAEAKKWESRAKANGKQVKDLTEAQRSSMTEAERAVAEAEERGRTAATSQYRDRLVTTEFAAAVARRNPEAKPDDYLELLDLSKLADEHGEPDTKAIEKAAQRLVPEPDGRPPSFDSGARTSPPKGDSFSDQIRAGFANKGR